MPVNEAFIKIPSRNVLDFSTSLPPSEDFENLFIDDIGGVELSQIGNYHTIYGTNKQYVTIYGLDQLDQEYDPMRLLLGQEVASFFQRYNIDYTLYFDYSADTFPIEIDNGGDMLIYFNDIPDGINVEVQIDSTGIIDTSSEAVQVDNQPG